ncbi:hypothetical protein [Microbacterium murale]|uniref:Uncharacterized protein n=1 Tax=Microbacterium murale TaxID=1081040 RepID=A0ABU0PB56_9MICO|nr:hypothetical protein [Microbacterium murale]MDQ0644585.1 hypothetical protein [Microbacterium murale]
MTEENKGFSRRTVVKGAAWSVPVIAAAVATPLAAASVTPTWNGTVTGNCAGDYDISVLTGIVGAGLVGVVQTALGVLGLEPNATREFTITATTGDIPAGTVYELTDPNALLTVGGLESVIGAGVAGIASTTGGFVLTLAAPIPQGTSVTVDVYRALVNVGVLSSFTLTQTTADAVPGDNTSTLSSLAAVAVNLGDLGIPFVTGSLAVQTCG